MENKIIIYKSKLGKYNVKVKFDRKTVWLSQAEIGKLFNKDTKTINEHIQNIYQEKELNQKSTIRKFQIVQEEGKRKVKRGIIHYSLDTIISIGYRVKSLEGTKFRIWATKTLNKYLIQGYIYNQKRLDQLNKTISLISTYSKSQILSGHESEVIDLIKNYSDSLILLKNYDSQKIGLPKLSTLKNQKIIEIDEARQFIEKLRQNKPISSDFFGNEYDHKLDGVIGAIYQSFDSHDLYQSIEEKAANLLYLVIKDHPFTDGNKRIGSSLFIYFLNKNKYLHKANGEIKINDRGLVALALLIATSNPKDKEIMVNLTINLIKN